MNKFIKFKFTRNVTVFAVDEMPPTGIVINGDVGPTGTLTEHRRANIPLLAVNKGTTPKVGANSSN